MMRRVLWLAGLVGLALVADEVRAQGVIIVDPGAGFVNNTVGFSGTEVGFSFRRKHLSLSVRSVNYGGYGIGYYSFSPYLAGPGYLIYERPGLTTIVVQPPVVPWFAPQLDANARATEWVARQRAMLDPVQPKEGPIIVKVEPREEKPKEPPKVVRPDPDKVPAPPIDPNADPKTKSAGLARLGREAYAQEAYGRAVQRFRQATDADANNAEAQFLLGEALFALGKYREAVDAIQRGLVLQPDWPKQPFRPLELYGANVADYSDHIFTLESVLKAQPNDPDLLFLMAYQRWFDGRKEEARQLFQQALRQGANAAAVQSFLQVAANLPVV